MWTTFWRRVITGDKHVVLLLFDFPLTWICCLNEGGSPFVTAVSFSTRSGEIYIGVGRLTGATSTELCVNIFPVIFRSVVCRRCVCVCVCVSAGPAEWTSSRQALRAGAQASSVGQTARLVNKTQTIDLQWRDVMGEVFVSVPGV